MQCFLTRRGTIGRQPVQHTVHHPYVSTGKGCLVRDAKTSVRLDAQAVSRQNEALALLLRGRTYDEIARELGYASRSGAHKAVKAALERAKVERLELAGAVLDVQIGRYEGLLKRSLDALDEAEEGREVGRAQLISAARGVLDSISRLHGLDKPAALVTVRAESGLSSDLARLAQFIESEGDGGGRGDE